MSKVKVIPAHPQHELMHPKRVAAYCRVSTTQEMQYHSLEAQREYLRASSGKRSTGYSLAYTPSKCQDGTI